jgi:hypothetical protein
MGAGCRGWSKGINLPGVAATRLGTWSIFRAILESLKTKDLRPYARVQAEWRTATVEGKCHRN